MGGLLFKALFGKLPVSGNEVWNPLRLDIIWKVSHNAIEMGIR